MAVIRHATDADAAAVAAIYAPFCLESAVSFEEVAPTAEEMAGRIRATSERLPWLVLEDGGVAGYVYARPFRERAAYRWTAEVTVYVAAVFHRRGVARALYTTLLGVLAELGYSKAIGGITLPNEASVALHRAMGFTAVGVFRGIGYKFGAWHDVGFYQRVLRPEEAVPPEPRPFHELLGSTAWRQAVAAGLALYR